MHVVAKVLIRRDPVWRWYFARELEVYDCLPDAVSAPAIHSRSSAEHVLVLARAPGAALGPGRRTVRDIDDRAVLGILELLRELANWQACSRLPTSAPPGVIAEMRRRLLEDPTSPRAWFLDGIARCAARGILTGTQANAMRAALLAYPRLAPCHGDLLPRNLIVDGHRPTLIDWECAGLHLRDWDRALLWVGLPIAQQERVETDIASDRDPQRRAAFFALIAFAFARELQFSRRGSRLKRAQLHAELSHAVARLWR